MSTEIRVTGEDCNPYVLIHIGQAELFLHAENMLNAMKRVQAEPCGVRVGDLFLSRTTVTHETWIEYGQTEWSPVRVGPLSSEQVAEIIQRLEATILNASTYEEVDWEETKEQLRADQGDFMEQIMAAEKAMEERQDGVL